MEIPIQQLETTDCKSVIRANREKKINSSIMTAENDISLTMSSSLHQSDDTTERMTVTNIENMTKSTNAISKHESSHLVDEDDYASYDNSDDDDDSLISLEEEIISSPQHKETNHHNVSLINDEILPPNSPRTPSNQSPLFIPQTPTAPKASLTPCLELQENDLHFLNLQPTLGHQSSSQQPQPTRLEVPQSRLSDSNTKSNSCTLPSLSSCTTSTKSHFILPFKSLSEKLSPSSSSNIDTTTTTTTTTTNEAPCKQSSPFHILPMDAIHTIAGYLTAKDWCNFGITSRDSNHACKQVLRRVKLHGFKCAMEVVTAWDAGEHADAKELAALYLQCGVPIYPFCFGHSYHTLTWRMKVEMAQIRQSNESNSSVTATMNNNNNNSTINNTALNHTIETDRNLPDSSSHSSDSISPRSSNSIEIDRFYAERNEARIMEGYFLPNLTYLEEKACFFWNIRKKATRNNDAHHTNSEPSLASWINPQPRRFNDNINNNRPNTPNHNNAFGNMLPPLEGFHNTLENSDWSSARFSRQLQPRRRPTTPTTPQSLPSQRFQYRPPKMTLSCHRHLIDRHLSRRAAVCDRGGSMTDSPISLSADFFHVNDWKSRRLQGGSSGYNHGGRMVQSVNLENGFGWRSNAKNYIFEWSRRENESVGLLEGADSSTADSLADPRGDLFMRNEYSMFSTLSDHVNMSEVSLRVYSSVNDSIPKSGIDEVSANNTLSPRWNQVSKKLLYNKKRFAVYETKLNQLSLSGNYAQFDDCLLDFWDEFFPLTAMVHYYDRHTAVPRLYHLEHFLSTPCPKSLGTVQCYIERVKVSRKKKGVNVKTRFFPSYEYRLFIKDHRHRGHLEHMTGNRVARVDTLLMVATLNGNHLASSKKGVNNYYLCAPGQEEVIDHFKAVNKGLHGIAAPYFGHKLSCTPTQRKEICRLQSNFIGTEFQMFRPIPNPNAATASTSNNSFGTEIPKRPLSSSVVSSRSLSSSFLKIGKRSKSTNSAMDDVAQSSEKVHGKSRSWPFSRNRTSLRAIANSTSVDTSATKYPPKEVEIGAITYTANLLGNRPRIMDVCIPKVLGDGTVSNTWKEYCESMSCDSEEACMLQKLKVLSNQIDEDALEQNSRPDYGLLALQNRPPWWNVELNAFVLNFGGRVSVASVKNFQLCDRDDHENIMLQFGRIDGRHSFTMDFSYPLSPMQAFAIAISSLQSKISFG